MVVREERKRGTDRNDDRDSHSRRRYSRREREPSLKKLRRDRDRDRDRERERERERDEKKFHDVAGRDSRRSNSLRETEKTRDVKRTEARRSTDGLKDSSETKNDNGSDANRIHPDPKEFARSKIFLQHDDRGSSGQVVQIHIRHDDDNKRSNLKEHRSGERSNEKTEIEAQQTTKKKDDSGCGHDGNPKLESAMPSEKKMPLEPELDVKKPNREHKLSDSVKVDDKKPDTRDETFGRRDDRVGLREHQSRSWRDDRFDRRDRGFNRGNGNRNGYRLPRNDYRDRVRGRGPPTGQDSFRSASFREGNQQQQVTVAQADRWKHDKFEEANQSPTNEDEQIAKVEKLLAL